MVLLRNRMKWDEKTALKYSGMGAKNSSRIMHTYPELLKLGLIKDGDSVLSIGAGAGEIEIALMQNQHIKLGYIDPSPAFVKHFRNEVTHKNLDSQVTEIFTNTFQNYTPSQKYHVIICIHAWQYIGFDESQLKKAINLLDKNGALCIALTSEKAFNHELKNLVHPHHGFINYEELSRWASQLGYANECHHVTNLQSFEQFLLDDEFTEYSINMMCLLSRKDWNEISDNIKNKAKTIFHRYEKNAYIDNAWGFVIFHRQGIDVD